jgi:hypothetical protein
VGDGLAGKIGAAGVGGGAALPQAVNSATSIEISRPILFFIWGRYIIQPPRLDAAPATLKSIQRHAQNVNSCAAAAALKNTFSWRRFLACGPVA